MSDPGDRKRGRGRSRERDRARHVSEYVDDPYSFGDSDQEQTSQSASQSTPASSQRSSQSRRTPSSSQPRSSRGRTRASIQRELENVSERLKMLYSSRPLSSDILKRCDRYEAIETRLQAELDNLGASPTLSPARSPTPPTTSPPPTSARSPTPPPPPQAVRRARSPTRRPPHDSASLAQSPRSPPPPPQRSRSRSRGEEESDSQEYDSSDDDGNETVRQQREARRSIPVPGPDERSEYKKFVKATAGISRKDTQTAMREFDRCVEVNRRQSRNPRLNLSEINRAPNKVTFYNLSLLPVDCIGVNVHDSINFSMYLCTSACMSVCVNACEHV